MDGAIRFLKRLEDPPVFVAEAGFVGVDGEAEAHRIVIPLESADQATQLQWLCEAEHQLIPEGLPRAGATCFRRVFASDAVNQSASIRKAFSASGNPEPALSIVGQAPGWPARVALWSYRAGAAHGPGSLLRRGDLVIRPGGDVSHHWAFGITSLEDEEVGPQAIGCFERLARLLETNGIVQPVRVVRTWWTLPDIDRDYPPFTRARGEAFARRGITRETGFIASTGIGGAVDPPAALTCLDAFAISGLPDHAIRHLNAPQSLGPAADYGATFERGTVLQFRDRSHILISGTASIDPDGTVLFAGDPGAQTDRCLLNIAALLRGGGASMEDCLVVVGYVRDGHDRPLVEERLERAFPGVPRIVLTAAVCRPAWLVEVECWAVVKASEPLAPRF